MLMPAGFDAVYSQRALVLHRHGSCRWILACFFLFSSSFWFLFSLLYLQILQEFGQELHWGTCCRRHQGPISLSLGSWFRQQRNCHWRVILPLYLLECQSTQRTMVLLEA